MTAQIVEIAGQKMAMLPIADYERLLELAEDRGDAIAASAAEQRRRAGEEYLPAPMVDRLLGGESPLRVWRSFRGVTQRDLSAAVGISHNFLSDLEAGRRRGAPNIWRKLAGALNVTIDDIISED
jgi:DNA-binding XRE family transcriptional regulator